PETVTLSVVESIGGDNYTFVLLPVGNAYGTIVPSSVTPTSASFELTAPGTYMFRATNNTTGCYEQISHTIAPYDLIDVMATATAPAICFGDAGELTITVSGYTGAYDYEVFRNDETSIVSGSGNTASGPLAIT